MIGRRSTLTLSEVALTRFSEANRGGGIGRERWVPWDPVYDFAFENDFEPQFCNSIKYAASQGERAFQEFILRLHTGESVTALRGRAVDSPELEGQIFLRRLSQALLAEHFQSMESTSSDSMNAFRELIAAGLRMRAPGIQRLLGTLELDGYAWTDGRLVHRESAPVDAEKHRELLSVFARELGLAKQEVLAHNMKLSEDAYREGRWEDCIGNARKAMELAFQESAALWSRKVLGQELDPETYKWPGDVRKFLEAQGLLTEDERKAAAANYGMFSGVGNHPYIAQNDQARMGRQIALILTEFVMLRTREALKAKGR